LTTHRQIVDALFSASAAGEQVVLATVVRVTGSSYGGVGARMLIRPDGSTVGLVSGGCLESDLAEHARRVNEGGRSEVVRYDTRDDDDAPWGLGLGCNGMIDVLLEPFQPERANYFAKLLRCALVADVPSVLATVISSRTGADSAAIGAHALVTGNKVEKTGGWGKGICLAKATANVGEAIAAGRRGLVRDLDGTEVAYEVVAPATQLVVCGSGPDARPIARIASDLGWDVTVVDHRGVSDERAARFPGARLAGCEESTKLSDSVRLTPRTAAVVMSHHVTRDTGYIESLLHACVAYIGVLGPRGRTEKMLSTLGDAETLKTKPNLFFPVGMDIGGEGPDAIALAIIAEISAVLGERSGGHLRDKKGALHAAT
jgi:xanthine dehydrogenase accessory factor